jgi:hypothetical protein
MQPDRFLRLFRRAYDLSWAPSERESLAFELYNESFFEKSPRARFLALVIAVEALLDPKPRGSTAAEHVQQLIDMTNASENLTESERNSIVSSLRSLRNESIAHAGRTMAQSRLAPREYMGMSAQNFFRHCYALRSKMVHGAGVRDDEPVIGSTAASLQTFVADVLAGALVGFDA